MTLFAQAATIFYVISLVLILITLFFRYVKKDKKLAQNFLMLSVIFIVEFVVIALLSVYLQDPIPYFNEILISGAITAGVLLPLASPRLIASEVKKELIEEEKITYRELSYEKAKSEIIGYLEHRKEETWIENIIDDLKIDPKIVIKVIKKLHNKGKITEAK